MGQTLGSYGIGTGCYFVLPILGPTTVRAIGMIADTFVEPVCTRNFKRERTF